MANRVVIKSPTGHFYVEGQGFAAVGIDKATVLSEADIKCVLDCARKWGVRGEEVIPVKDESFAVCYIRKTDIGPGGEVIQNLLNPSRRRFATEKEATQHGSRFGVRKGGRGQAPGSAGHKGFYVIKTADPVKDVVNWATGLTNPAPGQPQTFAERKRAGTTIAQLRAKG